MASSATGSTKLPRSRKSIGYLPSPDEDVTSLDKENQDDVTTALDLRLTRTKTVALNKRSRSRSLGPGGLDALREDAGNRRKAAAVGIPKSILKPSIPLSPLKDIPIRKASIHNKNEQSKVQSPQKLGKSPIKTADTRKINVVKRNTSPGVQDEGDLPVTGSGTTPDVPNVRESDQLEDVNVLQQEAKKMQAEASKQRDLRRKSMANRRVSFAPEATLHTWDMIEEIQDSTTSTASTSAIRRASITSGSSVMMSPISQRSPRTFKAHTDDPPSTPPSQAENDVVTESPTSQRNLHQKKWRRNSSVPPLNFNNPDDVFSSPADSTSNSDINEGSITKEIPATVTLVNFPVQSPNRGSVDKTSSLSVEELGDISMDLADDEITAAFKPWSQKLFDGKSPLIKLTSSQLQDNTNPFSPAFKNATKTFPVAVDVLSAQGDGEMSMDITCAIGSIASKANVQNGSDSVAKPSPIPRRSMRNRHRVSIDSTSMEDASMDLTAAIGVIQPNNNESMDVSNIDTNEDLSMEFTSVFGKISSRKADQTKSQPTIQLLDHDDVSEHERIRLDTELVQGIEDNVNLITALAMANHYPVVQSLTGQDNVDEEDMDITCAVGTILSSEAQLIQSHSENKFTKSKDVFLASPPESLASTQSNQPMLASPSQDAAATMDDRARRQCTGSRVETRVTTPMRRPKTPTRQMSPVITEPTTPGKTPPFKDVESNNLSSTKLFEKELKHETSKQAATILPRSEPYGNNVISRMLLSPRFNTPQRICGIGINKEGLGSPRVTMLLDRRASIGENAATFLPSHNGARTIHFDNPRTLNRELALEREREERRESQKHILEQDVDIGEGGRDVTTTLKEAIVSMTPKRKRPGERKSLAVGAAKGLLGVRPAELDESDEDRTPRGIRSGHTSPVKKIKLSEPYPAMSMLGHINKQKPNFVDVVPTAPSTISPSKKATVTTPKSQGRSNDAEDFPNARLPMYALGHQHVDDAAAVNGAEAREKIHLQDFLNFTSIRFIELSTTKRRHTIAPQNDENHLVNGFDLNGNMINVQKGFEEFVVAGACTVPLLELFQHSCRELKKYIAEGRDVIQEIEAETYNDNPALFHEYISALPADRTIMDQQFKNMKTHARLVSKGMWYEWRMKLLEGLKEGLNGNAGGLQADAKLLLRQEQVVNMTLPKALEERDALISDCAALQARADEMANSDHEELKRAQEELLSLEHETKVKKQLVEDYKRGYQAFDSAIKQAQQTEVECWQSIREAQKLREECRGWSAMDVSKLKASVDALEATYGWTITSTASGSLTLVYRRELEVYFSVSSFLPATASSAGKPENSRISLVYIGDTDYRQPKLLSTEKRFFLQLMRAHVQCLPEYHTSVKDLLRFVQEGWDKACEISIQVSKLDVEFITNCRILSDERLSVITTMLLSSLKTKVQVIFEVSAAGKGEEMEMALTVKAGIVYGEKYKEDRMADFLMSKVARGPIDGRSSWVDAVRDLKKRLISQGRKH